MFSSQIYIKKEFKDSGFDVIENCTSTISVVISDK